PSTAPANVVQYDVGSIFSAAIVGTTPAASPPWMTAKFDDGGGTGAGTFEFAEADGRDAASLITEVDFKVVSSVNPSEVLISATSKVVWFDIDQSGLGTDIFQAEEKSAYDIGFSFGTSNAGGGIHRFAAGEKVTYTITGIASLSASSFDVLSAPAGGAGPFKT